MQTILFSHQQRYCINGIYSTYCLVSDTISMQIGGTIPNETIVNAIENGNHGNVKNTPGFPNVLRNLPNGNAGGIEWKLTSHIDNNYNWREIRKLNSTHNWSNGEFIDRECEDTLNASPWFCELCDLISDYNQMTNLYPMWSLSTSMKEALDQLDSMLMDI